MNRHGISSHEILEFLKTNGTFDRLRKEISDQYEKKESTILRNLIHSTTEEALLGKNSLGNSSIAFKVRDSSGQLLPKLLLHKKLRDLLTNSRSAISDAIEKEIRKIIYSNNLKAKESKTLDSSLVTANISNNSNSCSNSSSNNHIEPKSSTMVVITSTTGVDSSLTQSSPILKQENEIVNITDSTSDIGHNLQVPHPQYKTEQLQEQTPNSISCTVTTTDGTNIKQENMEPTTPCSDSVSASTSLSSSSLNSKLEATNAGQFSQQLQHNLKLSISNAITSTTAKRDNAVANNRTVPAIDVPVGVGSVVPSSQLKPRSSEFFENRAIANTHPVTINNIASNTVLKVDTNNAEKVGADVHAHAQSHVQTHKDKDKDKTNKKKDATQQPDPSSSPSSSSSSSLPIVALPIPLNTFVSSSQQEQTATPPVTSASTPPSTSSSKNRVSESDNSSSNSESNSESESESNSNSDSENESENNSDSGSNSDSNSDRENANESSSSGESRSSQSYEILDKKKTPKATGKSNSNEEDAISPSLEDNDDTSKSNKRRKRKSTKDSNAVKRKKRIGLHSKDSYPAHQGTVEKNISASTNQFQRKCRVIKRPAKWESEDELPVKKKKKSKRDLNPNSDEKNVELDGVNHLNQSTEDNRNLTTTDKKGEEEDKDIADKQSPRSFSSRRKLKSKHSKGKEQGHHSITKNVEDL